MPSEMGLTLADVMPQACAVLGLPDTPEPLLPTAQNVVVLLVDGMGYLNLVESGVDGVGPLLASPAISSTFPSTTPVSLASLGTGLLPGAHGFVGATFPLPEFDQVLKPLKWEEVPAPVAVQPEPTWFERAEAAGALVTRIGPAAYAQSGLTQAVLRGGRHVAANNLEELVSAVVDSVAVGNGQLIYAYYPVLDKLGHVHGVASDEWHAELVLVTHAVAELTARLEGRALLLVTADHGMLDVKQRLWLEDRPGLLSRCRLITGEPRLRHVFAEPGQAAALLRDWRAVEDIADVFGREEFIATGILGPVEDFALDRIGDVVAVARGADILASRTVDRRVSSLVGHHGANTVVERSVPLAILAG